MTEITNTSTFVQAPSDEKTAIRKRLVIINNQIQWLEKIRSTLEHKLNE